MDLTLYTMLVKLDKKVHNAHWRRHDELVKTTTIIFHCLKGPLEAPGDGDSLGDVWNAWNAWNVMQNGRYVMRSLSDIHTSTLK